MLRYHTYKKQNNNNYWNQSKFFFYVKYTGNFSDNFYQNVWNLVITPNKIIRFLILLREKTLYMKRTIQDKSKYICFTNINYRFFYEVH